MKKRKLPEDWKAGLDLNYLPFSRNIGVGGIFVCRGIIKYSRSQSSSGSFFFFMYGKHRKTLETGKLSSVLTRNSYITAQFAYARKCSFTSLESIMHVVCSPAPGK